MLNFQKYYKATGRANLTNIPTNTDANNGPTTGIHEYCQSELPTFPT